jgi:hypothetical protein
MTAAGIIKIELHTTAEAMSTGKIEGKVHFIEETKTYGQKGFRKRLIVIEQENGRFTNYLPIEFVQDSCDEADQMTVGSEVEVSYFLSAEATGFRMLSGGGSSSSAAPKAEAPKEDAPYGETFESDEDPPF